MKKYQKGKRQYNAGKPEMLCRPVDSNLGQHYYCVDQANACWIRSLRAEDAGNFLKAIKHQRERKKWSVKAEKFDKRRWQ